MIPISGGVLNLLGAIIIYRFVVYPMFFSPLSKVPCAHWSCRISCIWSLCIRYRGIELEKLIEAHTRLGPLIQVGPSDLSVSSYRDGIRKVYDAGFEKPSNFYNFFNYFGRVNAFTSPSKLEHGFHRRRVSPVYTKSALFSSTQLRSITCRILYGRMLPYIRRLTVASSPIDTLELSYSTCFDYISSFLLGHCNGTNFLDGRDSLQEWREMYEQRMCHEAFWYQELPKFTRLSQYLGFNLMPTSYRRAVQYLEQWLLVMCERAKETIKRRDLGSTISPEDEPIVYERIKETVEEDSGNLDETTKQREIGSELFDHISASREVIGLVLGYSLYYLAQSPDAQSRLRSELTESGNKFPLGAKQSYLEDASEMIPSPACLDRLPYLSAVINESIRMRPNSTPLPRITPSDRGVSVAGFDHIPPGTRINSFQWFVHRDPNTWDKVDKWIPERWMTSKSEKCQRYNNGEDVLWGFASGPRICLGTNLTQYMLRYILGCLISNFQLVMVSEPERAEHSPGSPADKLMIHVVPTREA